MYNPGGSGQGTEAGGKAGETTVFLFGRFRLCARQRRLFGDEKPIKLGSRAFELLAALVEANGRIVAPEDIRKRIWPRTVVADHNIVVQVAAVRKALGHDRGFVRTEPGRGYRFVAPVTAFAGGREFRPADNWAGPAEWAGAPNSTNIPAPIAPLIGRDSELGTLLHLLHVNRLVTLTGTGGIGKTQLALGAARIALPRFADGIWFVELGALDDPELVPGAIARTLRIEARPGESLVDHLALALQQKHMLLVLDSCEHVVDAVSIVCETLVRAASGLHILITSQQPLAVEGEHVFPVGVLRLPPKACIGANDAQNYSAVQLFVERARAANPRFTVDDETARTVSRICRQLDGIPLAIEFAAARVVTIGVDELAAGLDDRFKLLTGRRTALPRQQTLKATLDWSYGLLKDSEQAVLRRLAIFSSGLTLEGARAVAAFGAIDEHQAVIHVADLVSKSLVTFEMHGSSGRYRLLETTRAYALQKLIEHGEYEIVASRHAKYHRRMLEGAKDGWLAMPQAELTARYSYEIDDITAALNRAFEPGGDSGSGVALTAAAVPLWNLLSALNECRHFVSLALSRQMLPTARVRDEVVLQAALAISSMWACGPDTTTYGASQRTLNLAAPIGDAECQLRAYYVRWMCEIRVGRYRASLASAHRFRQVAEVKADLLDVLVGDRLEGVSLLYLGEYAKARTAIERLLAQDVRHLRCSFVTRFGLDQRVAAFASLARILWLQGFPDQARRAAQAAVEEARTLSHANSLCMALCDGACSVATLNGDIKAVHQFSMALMSCSEKHGLGNWLAYQPIYEGWIAANRGEYDRALPLLRDVFYRFPETRPELWYPAFTEAYARTLAHTGNVDEALEFVRNILDEALCNDGQWCVPELLRIRAELLLWKGGATAAVIAERDFQEALTLSRGQGARSFQLRVATSLARLWSKCGRVPDAYRALTEIYDTFTEGFGTTHLKTAKELTRNLLNTC